MNQVIDLTSDQTSADVVAMEIDTRIPIEHTNAPLLGSSTAAPALGLHFAATTAPSLPVAGRAPARAVAPARAPPHGIGPSANELRHSQREKMPSRQRILMDRIGEQPQQLRMNRRNVKISLQEMQAHLDTISIGLRPSDPTVTDLPDELPTPIHPSNCTSTTSDIQVINLSEWTQERLNVLAATTVVNDPFTLLLEDPPSAPKERLGRFTGQQNREKIRVKPREIPKAAVVRPAVTVEREEYVEKKREKKVVSVAVGAMAPRPAAPSTSVRSAGDSDGSVSPQERISTLHNHISIGKDVPWSSLGKQTSVRAGGLDILVLPLWTAVQKLGGFNEVTNQRLWSAVGRELGLDTNVFHGVDAYKNAYSKYLLPYETYLKHRKTEEAATAQRPTGIN